MDGTKKRTLDNASSNVNKKKKNAETSTNISAATNRKIVSATVPATNSSTKKVPATTSTKKVPVTTSTEKVLASTSSVKKSKALSSVTGPTLESIEGN